MKERPILFSAPMVRAILAGAKTQTRRVVKLPKWAGANCIEVNERDMPLVVAEATGCLSEVPCPYGQPGDRLWVREAHRLLDCECDTCRIPGYVYYDADCGGYVGAFQGKKRPSIHMPRWASRITLEITGVRVERLNDISEADAKAEGCQVPSIIYPDEPRSSYSYAEQFRLLLESISGPGSWAANPWVWVVEFKRLKGGA